MSSKNLTNLLNQQQAERVVQHLLHLHRSKNLRRQLKTCFR